MSNDNKSKIALILDELIPPYERYLTLLKAARCMVELDRPDICLALFIKAYEAGEDIAKNNEQLASFMEKRP